MDKSQQVIDPLPPEVQECIDAYGKYYAEQHQLGMSVRDDMKYVASVAIRSGAVPETGERKKSAGLCMYCGKDFQAADTSDGEIDRVYEAAIAHDRECPDNPLVKRIEALSAVGKREQEPVAWRWREGNGPWKYGDAAPLHASAFDIQPLYPFPWDFTPAPATQPINQCDGCRRGLPVVDGRHDLTGTVGSYPNESMVCTAARYAVSATKPTREKP